MFYFRIDVRWASVWYQHQLKLMLSRMIDVWRKKLGIFSCTKFFGASKKLRSFLFMLCGFGWVTKIYILASFYDALYIYIIVECSISQCYQYLAFESLNIYSLKLNWRKCNFIATNEKWYLKRKSRSPFKPRTNSLVRCKELC